MKRYACHRLYITPNHFIRRPAITLDEQGRVVAYSQLQEETSSTEWIGGIALLSNTTDIPHTRELNDLLHACQSLSEGEPLYAWHISNIDFEHHCLTLQSTIQRLSADTIISL